MRIEVPFARFSWIAAALWMPAAVGGWGRSFSPDLDALFGVGYAFAFLICLVLIPLSWSDHVGPQTGKGLLGGVLLLGAVVGTGYGLAAIADPFWWRPLAAALVYLVPVLVVGLANPEGITPYMLLVHAFVAGGLAHGVAQKHHLALGILVPLLTVLLGLGCAILRGVSRRR